MSNSDFPPSSWLGYGLDMTAASPNDINAVTQAILTAYNLIPLDSKTTKTTVADTTWDKPDNINIAAEFSVSSSFDSWADGLTTAEVLKASSSLSAQYMAVSGDASISYSFGSTFQSDRSYSLFSYNQLVAEVKFKSYGQSIDKNVLASAISNFDLEPFDSKDSENVERYRKLFNLLGSHVVTGASYGGRFQMTIFASNSDSSYQSKITADLGVEYNGLCTSGHIDASIATESQFKTFSDQVFQTVSCRGGDHLLSSALNTSYKAKDIYETYKSWTNTASQSPAVMNLETSPLWTIMTATFDPDIMKHADDVKKAFYWIMENPVLHRTKGVVTINSDWGEFGIASPSAYIIQDPDHPPTSDNLIFSGTKIQWGKEHSHNPQRDVTINFIVVNDGAPLNFVLSHGTDGSVGGTGRIDLTLEKNVYSNNEITDNNWNSKFFYNAPVNRNEQSTSTKKSCVTDKVEDEI